MIEREKVTFRCHFVRRLTERSERTPARRSVCETLTKRDGSRLTHSQSDNPVQSAECSSRKRFIWLVVDTQGAGERQKICHLNLWSTHIRTSIARAERRVYIFLCTYHAVARSQGAIGSRNGRWIHSCVGGSFQDGSCIRPRACLRLVQSSFLVVIDIFKVFKVVTFSTGDFFTCFEFDPEF